MSRVAVEYGWLDYVAGAGTLVSTIAALVALTIALRSAKDSARSAHEAAETSRVTRELADRVRDQVGIQKIEHKAFLAEMERQPKLSLAPLHLIRERRSDPSPEAGADMHPHLLSIEVHNAGTRRASDVLLNVFAPAWLDLHWSHPDGSLVQGTDPVAPAPRKIPLRLNAMGIADLDWRFLYRFCEVPGGATKSAWVRFAVSSDHDEVPIYVTVDHESLDPRAARIIILHLVEERVEERVESEATAQ